MIFKIEYIGPQIVEKAAFTIDRPDGSYRYIFFHFISPVTLVIDNQKVDAIPGTCILFTPRKEQKFFVEKNRLNHDFIDFSLIDESFFKNINFPLNIPLTPKMSSFITQQVKDIQKEKEMSEIGWEYICDEKLSELFINISRKIHHRNTFNSEKYAEEMKHKFEDIRLNMYQIPDRISVDKLAKSIGFSLSRFNELYKMYFHTTPIKDLTNARISRVEELIGNGLSTKEIIRKIGFSSEEYFYRWFKKHFKMTKEDYIKNKINL